MFMVSYYPMILVKINKGDKIKLHFLRNASPGYDNIADSDGPLVFTPISQGHTLMLTSSLIQILTTRGLFSGLLYEDPHAHIAKVRAVCKSFVGRPYLNLDVSGLRLFPLSLTGEATILFT